MDAQKDWPHEKNMGPKSLEPSTAQAQVGALPPTHKPEWDLPGMPAASTSCQFCKSQEGEARK